MSKQQVNSQSQSGAASFGDGYGYRMGDNGPDNWYPVDEAEAVLVKRVKVHVKAEEGGNAQGQAQIVQADYNVQTPYVISPTETAQTSG